MENRPQQLNTFIGNWGKEMGIVTKNKALSEMELYGQLKTAAVALDDMAKQAWKINGGDKIKNFNFKTSQVDEIIKKLNNTIEGTSASPELISVLNHQIKILRKSKNNGQTLQNVYKKFRDTSAYGNFEGAKFWDTNISGKFSEVLRGKWKTNKAWVKATKQYSEIVVGFGNSQTKGSKTK